MVVFTKIINVNKQHSNSTTRFIPREILLLTQGDLYKASLFVKAENWKQPKISISKEMDK